MVERESPERISTPVTESNTRVLETTLAELGVDTSFDNLNLASDKFTPGVKKVGEETVFVGRLEHPCAGGHFAQILNNVSPFRDQDLRGIIDDVDLPIRAQADYQEGENRTTSESIRLHERHREDPRVGPPYIRFAEDHATFWVKALGCATGWRVFDILQRIRFINSKEELASALSLEWQEILANIKEGQDESRRIYQIGNAAFRTRNQWGKFRDLSLEEKVKRIDSFLKKLDIQKKQEFNAALSLERRQTLVDLGTHRIRSNKNDPYGNRIRKGEVKFADNGRDVVISDGKETKVVIRPTGQSSERFSWRAIEYQFSEDYIKFSRYPVIAWKKDENGIRTFLTQQEAMPFVREFGLEEGEQGDTKLGEIAVAYFARDITKGWERKMTLKPLEGVTSSRGDDFEQPMRGGQVPVWVSLRDHSKELFSEDNHFFPKLEERMASAL